MEEQLISFETAKLAKEKGFILHQGHMKMYNDEDGHLFSNIGPAYDILDHCFHAPTQSLLQRWLREVYDIHVQILPYNYKYLVSILKYGQNGSNPNFEEEFNTYEEALERGLHESLKLIKTK